MMIIDVNTPQTHLDEESVDVRFLFPTPFVTAQVKNHREINRDLARLILARAEAHPSTSLSNVGGWQSETDFQDWAGAPGEAILAAARQLGNGITALNDRGGLKQGEIAWRINAWANVNRAGHSNEMHAHAGSYWSGVYYVDDGSEENAQTGGELELLDPRGAAPLMYAPQLKTAIKSCMTAGLSEFQRPQSGQLYMFPAWLYHGVRPYSGSRARISVAFNLCV
jgi:uncharacterized protein (TIGR02466 family)